MTELRAESKPLWRAQVGVWGAKSPPDIPTTRPAEQNGLFDAENAGPRRLGKGWSRPTATTTHSEDDPDASDGDEREAEEEA